MEKVNFKGWANSYRLANKTVELIVTTDVGPRIIHFGFIGKENEFKEFPEQVGQTGGATWNSFGGHRLWHAPEDIQRTYFPDNTPINFKEIEGGIKLTQPVETTTGIQKEIEVTLDSASAHVHIVHHLRNLGQWAVELAPWAISVMATGGHAVIPLPPRGKHTDILVPTSSLTLWAYTNMSDPRWTWGNHYVILRQDVKALNPQKIGAMVPDGWMGYANHGHFFMKTNKMIAGASYPDFGCSMETFTNDLFLEVESLGPVTRIEPKAEVIHIEDWYLFDHIHAPENDADIEKEILPEVKKVL